MTQLITLATTHVVVLVPPFLNHPSRRRCPLPSGLSPPSGNRGKIHLTHQKGPEASQVVRSGKADRRAADVAPIVHELQAGGASLRKVAAALNDRSIPTSQGSRWTATQVMRVLDRAGSRKTGALQ